MKPEFANASDTFKRLNPHLFGVGGVETGKPKPIVAQALVGGGAKRKQGGAVLVRISLVAHRRKLTDDDNNTGSFKPLRDAIARSLGIDDGDARIAFECGQVETKGQEGTSVRIEIP